MRVLIIDDHIMTYDFYRIIISDYFSKRSQIEFAFCQNCGDSKSTIDDYHNKAKPFDLAIVDFSLPIDEANNLHNGGDVSMYLKNQMPDCKTIIITSISDKFQIFDLIQNIQLDGFVIKSDMGFLLFKEILKTIVIDNQRYLSKEAKEIYDEINNEGIFIKKEYRMIVQLLAKGYRTEQIAAKMCLSTIAINKRMAKLKEKMGVDKDATILFVAKTKRYV